MLNQMDDFTFKHTNQIDKIYQSYDSTADLKTALDSQAVELRNFINALVVLLNSDGANNITAKGITGVSPDTTIQGLIQAVYDYVEGQIQDATTGAIPDGSILDVKLSNGTGQIKDTVSTHIAQNASASVSGHVKLGTISGTALEGTYAGNMASQDAGKGASMVGVQDVNNHFTGTTVETVLNELFTYANDGKTQVANAVTAKGVSASSIDTFSTLATKIGQISTGKKWASGTVVATNALDKSFYASSNQAFMKRSIQVSGLTFLPGLIVYWTDLGSNVGEFGVYKRNLMAGTNWEIALILAENQSTESCSLYLYKGDLAITASSFCLPVNIINSPTYNWLVVE
jgi:hypothetical protein